MYISYKLIISFKTPKFTNIQSPSYKSKNININQYYMGIIESKLDITQQDVFTKCMCILTY